MAISAILLDPDGWQQLTELLQLGQSNPLIPQNLIRHLGELGAQTVLVEDEYLDRDFTEAFAAYYARLFKRHTKLCRRAHFFSSDLSAVVTLDSPKELATRLQDEQPNYLGYITLRPIHAAPLAQATLLTPPAPAGHEGHPLVGAEYEVHFLGARLAVTALPMTQQDQRIGACAQATIWSAIRHFHARHKGPWVSTVGITDAAMKQEFSSVSNTVPAGSEFLSLNGMVSALRASDRKPLTYAKTGAPVDPWRGIRPADVVYRYVDSGIPVIIGLNVGGDIGHAVIASGHVHKPVPPTAAELPPHPTRASFSTAFYVNDDQCGPNLRMPFSPPSAISETAYTFDQNVIFLLIPLPDKVYLPAEKAEVFSWDLLSAYSVSWPQFRQQNAGDIGTSNDEGDLFVEQLAQNTVIARTYLTYGWKYKHRLMRNKVPPLVQALARATELPRFVWVTEFGTLASLSAQNIQDRRVFSHCVVDATAKNMGEDSRLFFHAPGMVVRRSHNQSDPNGAYEQSVHVVEDDESYHPKLRGNIDYAGY